jgi:hypothetical protein
MFVGLHVGLASFTKIEELAITQEEGETFMTAAQNVARHYSIETTQKTMDWIALCGCLTAMYGPRAIVVSIKMRNKRNATAHSKSAQHQTGNVNGWPHSAIIIDGPGSVA